MPDHRSLALLLLVMLGAQLACTDAAGPAAGEPLEIMQSVRLPVPGERLPRLDVTGLPGAVRFEVERDDFACPLVDVSIGRSIRVLTIVAYVRGNPAALCEDGWVVMYSGTIEDVAPGPYFVRYFERIADGSARLIGTRSVTVSTGDG